MSYAIGQIILQQLGGNRFIAMTGAKDFVTLDAGTDSNGPYRGGLMFKIPRGRNGATRVCIKLTHDDLYVVYFSRYSPRTFLIHDCGSFTGVYAEHLASLFTEQTGFDTRL